MKVFEDVIRRLAARGNRKLVLYYPSEECMTCINLMPELKYIDTVDCGDLFNGKDDRERIEMFRLRNNDMI